MQKLDGEVYNVIRDWFRQGIMFTVFDVTRVLRLKDRTVSHDEVRSAVRHYFSVGAFPMGWTNAVGYHLPYRPDPPHIYAPPRADILQYDPDALNPNRCTIQPKVTLPSISGVCAPTASSMRANGHPTGLVVPGVNSPYILYGLVDKKTGLLATNKRGPILRLYKNKVGPVAIRSANPNKDDYKVVKYEVILKEVE